MRASAFALRVPVPTLPTSVALLATLVLGPLMALAIAFEYWKSFALLLVVASVPALIRWPVAVAFGLYVFVLPFDVLAVFPGAGSISRLLGILAMGVLLGVGLIERRLAYPPVTALCLGLFALWGLLTLGWSVDLEGSLERVSTLVSLLLLYVVAVSFRVSAKELRTVIFVAILGAALSAAVPVIVGQDSVTKTRGVKLQQDAKSNINQFAAGLIGPLILAIGQVARRGQIAARVIAAGGMSIIIVSIYALASRGAAAACLVGIGYLVARSRRIGYGLAVAVVCVVLTAFAPDVFFARFGALLDGSDDTGSGRTRIWTVALSILEDYWMRGSGLGTFQDVYARYSPSPLSETAPVAHNTYFTVSVELGVLGLIFLLLTLGMHFRASLRCRLPTIDLMSIEAACVAVMANAALGERLYLKVFWLPWILLIWSARLHSESQVSEPGRWGVVGREDRLATPADRVGGAPRRSPNMAGSE